jgi:DNA-binding NarL/FixJ family response regulator
MNPGTIRVAVVHADGAQRDALADFISDAIGFKVVGGSAEGEEALQFVRTAPVNVLVVDIESLGDQAAAWIATARAESPAAGILLLVHGQPPAVVQDLMLRGAAGYVEVSRLATDLVAALRTLGMGRRYLPQAASASQLEA